MGRIKHIEDFYGTYLITEDFSFPNGGSSVYGASTTIDSACGKRMTNTLPDNVLVGSHTNSTYSTNSGIWGDASIAFNIIIDSWDEGSFGIFKCGEMEFKYLYDSVNGPRFYLNGHFYNMSSYITELNTQYSFHMTLRTTYYMGQTMFLMYVVPDDYIKVTYPEPIHVDNIWPNPPVENWISICHGSNNTDNLGKGLVHLSRLLISWNYFQASDTSSRNHVSDYDMYSYLNLSSLTKVLDYDKNCSTSCELDNLTTIENRGYSELDGIVTGGEIVNTPIGKAFDTYIDASSIQFDKHILPTGGNRDFSISIWYNFFDAPWQQHHNMFDNGGLRLTNGYTIFIHRSDKNLRFNKDGITEAILPNGSAVEGECVHLIVTSRYVTNTNTTSLDFYINGSLVKTDIDAKWNNDTEYSTDILLGNCWGNTVEEPVISDYSYRFKGTLANFQIFDKALTPIQANDVYQRDLTEQIHVDVVKDPSEWEV